MKSSRTEKGPSEPWKQTLPSPRVSSGTTYHRVSPAEARTLGLYTFSDVISPTGKSYAFQSVRVFTHLKRVVRKRPLGLKILLGLAEMRHRLGIPPHAWELFMKRKLEPGANPRALYRLTPDTEQLVAVVYDTGKWVLSDQARRAGVLGARYSAQVWGTPSLARQKSLERGYPLIGKILTLISELRGCFGIGSAVSFSPGLGVGAS